MQAPDPIETILSRLMPPALSERRQADIEEMLDGLVGPTSQEVATISSAKWVARSLAGGGIAAAIGAMCAVFPLTEKSDTKSAAGLVFLGESERIESVTDEGWREDSEGSAMHAVRLKSVQRNSVRDEQSGMVMQICEPREEILMVPASSLPDTHRLKKPQAREMVEVATLAAENNGPLRVVTVEEKRASFRCAAEGEAVVSREAGIYQVRICGVQGNVIFDGNLPQDGTFELLPKIWRNKVQILCRTLDQALDSGMMQTRQPQPRVTPPVPKKP